MERSILIFNTDAATVMGEARRDLQRHWRWLFIFGLLTAAVGVFAFVQSFVATATFVVIFSACLVVVAGTHAFQAVVSRRFGLVATQVALTLLYGVTGVLMLRQPLAAAVGLTLFMAWFFIIDGLIKLFSALFVHLPGFGWKAFSGFVSVLLGVLIYAQWPVSGLWVIGMFIGINLLNSGMQLASLGWMLRPTGEKYESRTVVPLGSPLGHG